jgi:hypothetical protein
MTSARAIATSLVIAAIALALIAKGVELLRFETAEVAATAILAREPGADEASREARRREIQRAIPLVAAWTATPGLAGRARRVKGLLTEALDGAAAAEPDLIDLLAVSPTAGRLWLNLAILRWRRGAPLEQALDALQMSSLTQPREFETMVARSLFLLRLWEFLPSDEQRFAVNQLVELNGRFNAEQMRQLQAIIAKKPEATRQALRQEFFARGAQDQALARGLGL